MVNCDENVMQEFVQLLLIVVVGRWWVVGGQPSGTTIHVAEEGTCHIPFAFRGDRIPPRLLGDYPARDLLRDRARIAVKNLTND